MRTTTTTSMEAMKKGKENLRSCNSLETDKALVIREGKELLLRQGHKREKRYHPSIEDEDQDGNPIKETLETNSIRK